MSYDYRSLEEKANLIREYGTDDEKKIEEIKRDRKASREVGCAIFIILFVVIPMLMGLVAKCSGNKGYDPYNDAPWEPRHTELQIPIQNNADYISPSSEDCPIS